MIREFDYRKPARTVDGRAARLVDTEGKGLYPLTYRVSSGRSAEADDHPFGYTWEGKLLPSGVSRSDLVNIPEVFESWIQWAEHGPKLLAAAKCVADECLGHSHSTDGTFNSYYEMAADALKEAIAACEAIGEAEMREHGVANEGDRNE